MNSLAPYPNVSRTLRKVSETNLQITSSPVLSLSTAGVIYYLAYFTPYPSITLKDTSQKTTRRVLFSNRHLLTSNQSPTSSSSTCEFDCPLLKGIILNIENERCCRALCSASLHSAGSGDTTAYPTSPGTATRSIIASLVHFKFSNVQHTLFTATKPWDITFQLL